MSLEPSIDDYRFASIQSAQMRSVIGNKTFEERDKLKAARYEIEPPTNTEDAMEKRMRAWLQRLALLLRK